jgi:hypothetical protein
VGSIVPTESRPARIWETRLPVTISTVRLPPCVVDLALKGRSMDHQILFSVDFGITINLSCKPKKAVLTYSG